MCQWGAIGRARAGQDFRTILRTYYPGTTVGPPNSARQSARWTRGIRVVAERLSRFRACTRRRTALIQRTQPRQAADHVARRRRSAAFCRRRSSRRTSYATAGATTATIAPAVALSFSAQLLGVALSRRRRAARSWTRSTRASPTPAARIVRRRAISLYDVTFSADAALLAASTTGGSSRSRESASRRT